MTLTPDTKLAGILAPLFALRGKNDLGVGDTAALREFIDWAAGHGFRLVQLLPINETGPDNSPYNAISALAIEPSTLDCTPAGLPDLTPADFDEITARHDLAALRAGPVRYDAVKKLKRELLWRAWENAGRPGAATEPWEREYAEFRALMEIHGTECWPRWPESGHGTVTRAAVLRPFFIYVQQQARRQWLAVKAHAESRGVALMGDIPFGVSYYSADVWAHPELFDHEWCGGCPPERVFEAEPFVKKWGQNWGIPLYRWQAHRVDGFAWWRERVRKVRDVFHFFRVDHILGFFRIYSFPWRPERNDEFLPLDETEAAARCEGRLPRWADRDDETAENRAFNCDQGEEVLSALVAEAGDWRLIGEDLGVVPPYVRPCLTQLGIAGFKIPFWENDPGGEMTAGAQYPRLSVTTWATHDFEPLAALWDGWLRNAPHETHRIAQWCGFSTEENHAYDEATRERLLRALFASESWMALVMITDALGLRQRFNQPGSVGDANWTERLAPGLLTTPGAHAKMQRLAAMLRDTGR